MKLTELRRYVFVLLLVFLPTQLGRHFWPAWSYINGIRVDYFAPTIYVTDILIGILFLLSLRAGAKQSFTDIRRLLRRKLLAMTAVVLFILLNIYFSYSPFVSLYKWLKVAEFGFLAYFVVRNNKLLLSSYKFLLIPVFYESVLAIWQFIIQGSVGGWWYFLGERTFNSSTAGIANAVVSGQLVLRPYGTLPHPNVLVGFLVVSAVLIFKQLTHISRKITAVVLGLVVLVLFLTPSRGDIWRGLYLRQQLNAIAVAQWIEFPIVGTGLGTSPLYPRNITNYALLHQPIHNIYLLLLSEAGIIGLGLFLFLVSLVIRGSVPIIRYTLYAILVMGLFDHYFLTLQQGQLLFALVIGTMLGIKRTGGDIR